MLQTVNLSWYIRKRCILYVNLWLSSSVSPCLCSFFPVSMFLPLIPLERLLYSILSVLGDPVCPSTHVYRLPLVVTYTKVRLPMLTELLNTSPTTSTPRTQFFSWLFCETRVTSRLWLRLDIDLDVMFL